MNIDFSFCQLLFNVVIKQRTYCVHCSPLYGPIANLSGTHLWLIDIFRPFTNGVIQSTEYECDCYANLQSHVLKMCSTQYDIDDVHDRILVIEKCS